MVVIKGYRQQDEFTVGIQHFFLITYYVLPIVCTHWPSTIVILRNLSDPTDTTTASTNSTEGPAKILKKNLGCFA